MKNPIPVLSVGSLAYFDTYAGMIPCKVLKLTENDATIQLTAKRGAYKRGEIIETAARWHVVPRTAVYSRSGRIHIAQYTVAPQAGIA